MIKRLIKSRLAIAFATFALTAAMIGGATYAATSSPTDVYYACATLTGNIRASSIRLNSEPVRCSSTTDHVVQWDAAGQQIQPVAGRVIPLEGGIVLERAAGVASGNSHTWPAVDTSDCKTLSVMISYDYASGGQQNRDELQIKFANKLPQDETTYGYLQIGYPRLNYGSNVITLTNTGLAIPPLGALQVYPSNGGSDGIETATTTTLNTVSLYCTPY